MHSDTNIELLTDDENDSTNYFFRGVVNKNVIDKLETTLDIEKIFHILPKDLADLFKILSQTTTINEAVRISNIPRRTIYRRLAKIKTILIKNNFDV
jgi:hypothetical protein